MLSDADKYYQGQTTDGNLPYSWYQEAGIPFSESRSSSSALVLILDAWTDSGGIAHVRVSKKQIFGYAKPILLVNIY
jgi:hypothetical protein